MATTEQPSMQSNPRYIQLGPIVASQAASVSGSHSENPAYNNDAQPSPHQVPTYKVIPSDIDGTPHTVQGTQNVHCNQNPAYVHVDVHVEESFQTDETA